MGRYIECKADGQCIQAKVIKIIDDEKSFWQIKKMVLKKNIRLKILTTPEL